MYNHPHKKEFLIKPRDETINRRVLLEILNECIEYLNPDFFSPLKEEILNTWFSRSDPSWDLLRFENPEGKIVGFVGITNFSGKFESWQIIDAILPKYFQSSLPRIVINGAISLGKKKNISM